MWHSCRRKQNAFSYAHILVVVVVVVLVVVVAAAAVVIVVLFLPAVVTERWSSSTGLEH